MERNARGQSRARLSNKSGRSTPPLKPNGGAQRARSIPRATLNQVGPVSRVMSLERSERRMERNARGQSRARLSNKSGPSPATANSSAARVKLERETGFEP